MCFRIAISGLTRSVVFLLQVFAVHRRSHPKLSIRYFSLQHGQGQQWLMCIVRSISVDALWYSSPI